MPTKTKKKTKTTAKKTVEKPLPKTPAVKVDVDQKRVESKSARCIILGVIICVGIYFCVETLFPKAIPCQKGRLTHTIKANSLNPIGQSASFLML